MNKKILLTGLTTVCLTVNAAAVPLEAYRSYVRGVIAGKAGDVIEALNAYEEVVGLDRNASLAYRELSVLYWQLGRSDEAFAAADRLRELAGASVSTQLFLGSFYLLAGQSEKARDAWECALKIDPNNDTAILYLAAYYTSDNQPDRAVGYWNRFVAQKPDSAEGYYQLGVTQEKLGLLDRAKESFQKVLTLKPDSAETHLSLAQLYEKEEKTGAAAQEYERYLQGVPDNMPVLMYLGGLYYRNKNYAAAEDVFLRARELNPSDTSINFWLGVLAEERKDWDKAIGYFEFLRSKEETPAVLTRLSYYYTAKKDYTKSIRYLKRVVELEPQNPNSYYLLGLAYLDIRKFKCAEQYLKKAIALKPDHAEVYFHLGILYDQWGKFDKTVPAMEKTIALDPKHAPALNYLGYSFADRGIRLDEAERLVTRALEIEPENGSFMDSLGWVRYKQGRFTEAEQELEKTAGKLSDPVVWEHLGDTRMRLDKLDAAWDAYTKALEMSPKDKKVKKKLQALEKRVLPGTLQRKALKRAEGNLLQVATLKASFTVTGETRENNFRFLGVYHYSRPEKWRIDILGSFLAPQFAIVENNGIHIYPRSLSGSFSAKGQELLANVKYFFNADVLKEFDSQDAKYQARGNRFRYTQGEKTLVLDREHGTVQEYSIKDTLLVRFKDYALVEGLYLPGEIIVYSPRDKVSATIKLQGFTLNQPLEETIFTVPGEDDKLP